MQEWIAGNWPFLLFAVLYVVVHTYDVSASAKFRLMAVMKAIEDTAATPGHLGEIGATVKASVRNMGYDADSEIDTVLDAISPKVDDSGNPAPRVSRGKRIGRFLLKLLPVVARFL